MMWELIGYFVVGPLVLFFLARLALLRLHGLPFESLDSVVLGQRAARAVVAISFVLGALRCLLTIPGFASNLLLAHPMSAFWVRAVVIYYIFDCCVLLFFRQWNLAMWAHHFAAIGLFSFAWATDQGASGCMYALLAEAIVPWGFLLFYLRARGNTRSLLFKIVCLGGMATLIGRSLMWCWIFYLHNFWHYEHLHVAYFIVVNVCILLALALDRSWFGLYHSNWLRSGTEQMGRRTPSMAQL